MNLLTMIRASNCKPESDLKTVPPRNCMKIQTSKGIFLILKRTQSIFDMKKIL